MTGYQARRMLSHSPEKLFDLVADVERYPEFLPWWVAARVYRRDGDIYYADQVIRFGVVRQRFSSRARLCRPSSVDVASTGGPFRHLNLHWGFDGTPHGGCQIDFLADYEFRSKVIEHLFGTAFARSVDQIMAAFEARARQLYGPLAKASGTDPTGATNGSNGSTLGRQ